MELEQSTVIPDAMDSIDLDNHMRTIYRQRLESAEQFRESVNMGTEKPSASSCSKGTSFSGINSAMDRLRKEMVSLVDQDVSFLKQMLLMNERIEEIKSKRSFYKPKSYRKFTDTTTKTTVEKQSTTMEEHFEEKSEDKFSFKGLRRMTNLMNLADDQDIKFNDKCKDNARAGRDSGYYESDSSDED